MNYWSAKGDLENSDLPLESKFPIYLPKDHKFTELVVKDCRMRVQHCMLRSTLAELRFWVFKGRQFVKKVLRQCFICRKPFSSPPTLWPLERSCQVLECRVEQAGNFQAILRYLRVWKQWIFHGALQRCTKNCHLSFQNYSKLTDQSVHEITKKWIDEIKQAKYFSVLADEAADVSNIEQMAIVICFVGTNFNICEVLLGYTTCDEGLSGKAIAKKITDTISKLGLEMENCCGQGYDSAGNMVGKCSGAVVRILRS